MSLGRAGGLARACFCLPPSSASIQLSISCRLAAKPREKQSNLAECQSYFSEWLISFRSTQRFSSHFTKIQSMGLRNSFWIDFRAADMTRF
jgi:hypothetical protein